MFVLRLTHERCGTLPDISSMVLPPSTKFLVALFIWYQEQPPMRWFRRPSKPKDDSTSSDWGLESPILRFTERDVWTLRDACEGVQVFGAVGSGKTSGSGAQLAVNLLKTRMGGLVLAAKSDEPELWQTRYAQEAKRDPSDIVLFPDPKSPQKFDFLAYEAASNPHVNSRELTSLLVTAGRMTRPRGVSVNADYWEGSMQRLAKQAIEFLMLAGQLSVDNLRRVADKVAYIDAGDWEVFKREMLGGSVPSGSGRDVLKFFEKRLPTIPSRQREGFVDPFFTLLDTFDSGLLKDVFACGRVDSRVDPLVCVNDRKVIVMSLPTTLNASDGRLVQVLYKRIWQRAMQRRLIAEPLIPAFLWADESQMFASPEDMEFQQFARSSGIITVYLTQNLTNYERYLTREEVTSLLGNLQTKIFHANGDVQTNQFAVQTIGEYRGPEFIVQPGRDGAPEISLSHRSDRRQVDSALFTMLRKGGPMNSGVVDAIVFQAGRVWSNGKNWMRVSFKQKSPPAEGGKHV